MQGDAFAGIDFSAQVWRFRRSLNDLEDFALFISDIEEIAHNPQIDGSRILDHPEGRIAWTERYGFIFSVNDRIFFKDIFRRGPARRAGEPPDP